MYQFTNYQHSWKESFDPSVINDASKHMTGKVRVTEMPFCHEDCAEYCIHNTDFDERKIEKIYNAIKSLDETPWFEERSQNGFLYLKDDIEVEEFLKRALKKERSLEKEMQWNQIKPHLQNPPYKNKPDHVWQIVNSKGWFYDSCRENFVKEPTSTSCFPRHQFATWTIKIADLKDCQLIQLEKL